jgi:TPR repeat protein
MEENALVARAIVHPQRRPEFTQRGAGTVKKIETASRRARRCVLAAAVITPLGMTSPVASAAEQAAAMSVATEAYIAGRYGEAAGLLTPLAEAGNPQAQLKLATLYRTGAGVEADEYAAAHWYRLAAEQGEAEAQFHVGLMMLQGIGMTEDPYGALAWISKAAHQGFGDAVELEAYMLENEAPMAC